MRTCAGGPPACASASNTGPKHPWPPSGHSDCRVSSSGRIPAARRSMSAGFEHVNDPADHPAVINPRLVARVGGKMWRDLRELLVCQPELIENHRRFLSETLNNSPIMPPSVLWSGP